MLVQCLWSIILLQISEFCNLYHGGIGCLSINYLHRWKGYLRNRLFFAAFNTHLDTASGTQFSDMKPFSAGPVWPAICADSRNLRSSRDSVQEGPEGSLSDHKEGDRRVGRVGARVLHKLGGAQRVEKRVHCFRLSPSRGHEHRRENCSASN